MPPLEGLRTHLPEQDHFGSRRAGDQCFVAATDNAGALLEALYVTLNNRNQLHDAFTFSAAENI